MKKQNLWTSFADDSRFQIGNTKVISGSFLAGSLFLSSIPVAPSQYLLLFAAGFSCLSAAALGLELRRRSYRRLILEKIFRGKAANQLN